MAVNEGDAEVLEGLHEEDEGQLRGIGLGCKHAFAEKHFAEADAIEAAHEGVSEEGFHAVREAEVVEADIGLLHFLRQPGAVLASPGGLGAGADDVLEAGVDAKVEGVAREAFFEASGHMELVGLQHKARVRAVPQNGRAFGIPGENALAISQQQAFGVQVPADGEDTVGGSKLCGRKLEGAAVKEPIRLQIEETQKCRCPVSARTLFLAPPKVCL